MSEQSMWKLNATLIREKVKGKDVVLEYTTTNEQIANILNKGSNQNIVEWCLVQGGHSEYICTGLERGVMS